ncbi:hypothetical protein V4R08_07770 [Nitrobacter sp. NHB1]|uniref:hypothetical protein n=1 Tax=Nitrobacter sp. NHB1 TaxID=3119830 RepID=UPI002FFFF85C
MKRLIRGNLLARPSITGVQPRPDGSIIVADRAAKAEPILMLPGFRSLSIAVVLAVSMLIFGLGAAALLRATHEEFASVPLKQMPEVTFGSREETEQPTLAVLQVDIPAAHPAEPESNQAEAQHPATAAPGAQPESTGTAPPAADAPRAADAPSVATDSATPAASPEPSDSVPPATADTTPSTDAAAASAEPSEPPPGVETSVEAGDDAKPDTAKTDATKPDVTKSDAANSDATTSEVGASDVVETMTSPFGEHFRAPLPVNRPARANQVADPTPPAAKRSAANPPRAARRHHHRHRRVIRPSRRSSRPAFSGAQFAPD